MVETATLAGYAYKMTKLRSFLCGLILSLGTVFWVLVSWGIYELVTNGLDANMMGFEQEPVEGYAYWRWYFIRDSLPGNLVVGGILLAFGIFLGWCWHTYLRSLKRQRSKTRSSIC
jgi:hypothetical protein